MRYTDVWNDLDRKNWLLGRFGQSVTLPTNQNIWKQFGGFLKQFYNKDLLYKGYTIQPYSPKAGTGLSSHELNQPGTYRDVSDTTVVAQFKVKNLSEKLSQQLTTDNQQPIHILAWTTHSLDLPSNTALAVGRDIEYVLVKTFNQYTFEPINIILARPLLEKQFGKKL